MFVVQYKKRTSIRKVNIKSLNISVDFINSKVYLYEDGIQIGEYSYEINFKKKNMYISNLEIDIDYRDKGYGSYLARNIEYLARLYRLKTISLTDGATIDGFWKHLGYKRRKYIDNGTVQLCL